MDTIIDDLITNAIKRESTNLIAKQLLSVAEQDRLQCTVQCKSGKRCKHKAIHGEDKCHLRGNHGNLCDDESSHPVTTFRLGGGNQVKVSSEALFHIPKTVMETLETARNLDLSSLLCLENVLQSYPVARSARTGLIIHTELPETVIIMSKDVNSKQWKRTKTRHEHNRDKDEHYRGSGYHFFQGNMYATGGRDHWVRDNYRNAVFEVPSAPEEYVRNASVMTLSSLHEPWIKQPPMLIPRSNHSIVVVGDSKMFVLGGDISQTSVEMFDGLVWTEVASLPDPVGLHTAACAVGSKIYVFSRKTYCYDVEDDSWTIVNRTNQKLNRYVTATLYYEDTIIIKETNYTRFFSLRDFTFSRIHRDDLRHQCVAIGEKVYGMGSGGLMHVLNDDMFWKATEDAFPFCGIDDVFTTWCPKEASFYPWLETMIGEKLKTVLEQQAWRFLGSSPEYDSV
jgi:hypothetical protein